MSKLQDASRDVVAKLYVTATDEWPDVRVAVVNGENIQPREEPYSVFLAPPAVDNSALEELRRAICQIGIVGALDGHDVIRRESVLDIIDRRLSGL